APEDVTARDKVYTYEGKDITVYYNKVLCSHAAECSMSLAAVFDPSRKPWVDPDQGSADDIKKIVAACPSGALRYSEPPGPETHLEPDDCYIRIEKNGPYHVCNADIEDVRWAEGASRKKFVLCRCGKSGNKPFCDGAHYDVKWKDDETG
ncbi:MAG: (4Fe-4S)-binding protein, partial [Methyloligellaceae bacterium]